MTKTAKFIGTVHEDGGRIQQHYNLSDSGDVIVSQIWGSLANETYIFPSDADGNITDWLEMDGSQKGTISPRELLVRNGYEVTE